MKVLREWFVEAPWGKIALISWGNSRGAPVLLVHGRQDSAATFLPLVEMLPETHHYVGVDMPGNGRSDPFPHGVKISRFHFIAAVQFVIDNLQWKQFIFIGHSMGCEQGLFFNAAYPGRITKLVFLDLGPSLQRLQVHDPTEYHRDYYRQYYEHYTEENYQTKYYTREKATEAVMRARGFTRPQADVILARNLIQVGDDTYRLSWDRRLRHLAPQNYPVQYYIKLFSQNSPPTLLLSATDVTSNPYSKGKNEADQIINNLKRNLKHFAVKIVNGGHDVHFTNPERLAKDVCDFLSKDFGKIDIEDFDKANDEFKLFVGEMKEFYKCKL